MAAKRRPRPRAPRAAAPFALSATALATAYALAAPPPRPEVRLDYERREGAEHCPDAEALRRAVAARLGYDPFRDDAPVTISAAIERRGPSLRARLARRDGRARASGVREFESSDCDGLVATMAIAIGLAVDPFHQEPAAPPSASVPPPAPASASAEPAPPPPTLVVVVPPPAPAPPPPATPWQPYVGLGALAAVGAAPRPTAGLRVEAGLRRGAFSMGLEGRADLGASTDRRGPDVRSSLLVATLAPCAHRGPLALCALGSLGAVRGAGREVDVPEERSTLYAALGARAALDLRLSGPLSLKPHLDLLAPLRPVTLRVDGRGLWATPPVSAALGASALVSF